MSFLRIHPCIAKGSSQDGEGGNPRSNSAQHGPSKGPRTCIVVSVVVGAPVELQDMQMHGAHADLRSTQGPLQDFVDLLTDPSHYPTDSDIRFHDVAARLMRAKAATGPADSSDEEEILDEIMIRATDQQGHSEAAAATAGTTPTSSPAPVPTLRVRLLFVASVLSDYVTAEGAMSMDVEGGILQVIKSRALRSAHPQPRRPGACSFLRCSLWVTAPCMLPLFHETAADISVAADADPADVVNLMKVAGMALMPAAVPPDTLTEVREAATRRIQAAEQACAHVNPLLRLGSNLFAFAEFSSRGGQRFDLLFDEHSSGPSTGGDCSVVFRLAREGPWVPAVRMLLEDRGGATASAAAHPSDQASVRKDAAAPVSCMASVVYSRPGAECQDWHSDGAHLLEEALGPMQSDSLWQLPPPTDRGAYAVCVFLALIDLDEDVGFTQFWPGSHRYKDLVGFGGAAPLLRAAVDGIVPAGGAVLYDYRLLHRGMPNRSLSTERPLLQLVYHTPAYRETKNYGLQRLFPEAIS